MDNIHPNYTCSITHQIFYDPVVTEDGYIYERTAIEQWIDTKNTSPMTNKKISKNLISVHTIKQIIDDIIKKNPKLAKERYKPDMTYLKNIKKITGFIQQGKFNELLKYKNFDLKSMYDEDILKKFFKSCNNEEVIKHLFDDEDVIKQFRSSKNSSDLIISKCLTYISIYSNVTAIKYLVKGYRIKLFLAFFHMCCKNSNFDMIVYTTNTIHNLDTIGEDGYDFSVMIVINKSLSSEEKKAARMIIRDKIKENYLKEFKAL